MNNTFPFMHIVGFVTLHVWIFSKREAQKITLNPYLASVFNIHVCKRKVSRYREPSYRFELSHPN